MQFRRVFMPLFCFRPAEGQRGVYAADAVSGAGVDDMARTVAQHQQRQSVRVCVGASCRRLGRTCAQPDLRLRESRKHGPQLFILKRLPRRQKKHDAQAADAAVACQQLVQKMLRRLAPHVQPEKKRRLLCQLRSGRPASVGRFGLKISQREIHGQLRERDRLLLQADTGRLPGL